MGFYLKSYEMEEMKNDIGRCEVLRTSIHTARKEHNCSFCKNKILIGQKYRVIVQIFDDRFELFKQHEQDSIEYGCKT